MKTSTVRPFTRCDFARLAGVTRGAITKACDGVLQPAVLSNGRIDAAAPAARAYLKRRGVAALPTIRARPARAPTASAETRITRPPAPTGGDDAAETDAPPPTGRRPATARKEPFRVVGQDIRDVAEIADMTIRQVVARWGTVAEFREWLDATKSLETIREKNLRNAETEGHLISKKLIITHVMGALESGNRRLLSDAPKTMARRLYAAARADVPIEEAEQMVRDMISSQLKPMKDAAARMLRDPA